MVKPRLLHWLLAIAVAGICQAGYAQQAAGPEKLAEEIAVSLLKEKLPAAVELYYLDNNDNDEQSLAFKYDWNANQEWKNEFGDAGTDFSGSQYNFFARGNYVFKDDVNPSELSQIGANWSRRWFPIKVSNPLNEAAGLKVQTCVAESDDFDVGPEACRRKLGFGPTKMSYWYFDVDLHAKVEGDQKFDQRHYVYGIEANFSHSLGGLTFFKNPILTFGLEQVDPKGDMARDSLMASDDTYDRAYGKVGFTSVLGKINQQTIKLNFSLRYFKELSPEDVIEDAGLDTYRYTVVAIQIPAATFPGFDNTRNSFIVSYTSGELPFNRSSEKVFELGFRHDIDFSELF